VKIMPLTEAKARFSELIERLIHTKEKIVIAKRNKPVAVILPYDEWVLHPMEKLDGLAAAAGALADYDKEIDEMIGEIFESRRKAKGRAVRV
jgi:prevent-host-death family protein